MRVDVSINGVDFSASSTTFEFVDAASVTGLVPYVGVDAAASTGRFIQKETFLTLKNISESHGSSEFSYTVLPSVTSVMPSRGSMFILP